MIEGVATLRGVGILHRIVLLPISEDGATIDHVLGAMNYRPLPTEEELARRLIRISGSFWTRVCLRSQATVREQALSL